MTPYERAAYNQRMVMAGQALSNMGAQMYANRPRYTSCYRTLMGVQCQAY